MGSQKVDGKKYDEINKIISSVSTKSYSVTFQEGHMSWYDVEQSPSPPVIEDKQIEHEQEEQNQDQNVIEVEIQKENEDQNTIKIENDNKNEEQNEIKIEDE